MLIVQRIKTEWTKASRGGDGAVQRNATPDAMQLPAILDSTGSYLLHDIRYFEWEKFACHANVLEPEAGPSFQIEPLFLHVHKDVVSVRFVWSWNHCGAPERDSHEVFRLSPGQWGRFTCNGRFGPQSYCESEWIYQKTVFNVAFADAVDENLFTDTSPDAVDSRLAVLK